MTRNDYILIAGVAVGVAASVIAAIASITSRDKVENMEENVSKRASEIYEATAKKNQELYKASEEKYKELEKRLERKVNDISDSLNVDVPDEIVREALERAANNKISKAVDDASKEIIKDCNYEIRSQVRETVSVAYDNVKVDVKKELKRQIDAIDISGIKREVISDAKDKVKEELEDAIEEITDTFEDALEDAKKKATEKYEAELDTIATKVSNDLERSSKIYKVMSDKIGI